MVWNGLPPTHIQQLLTVVSATTNLTCWPLTVQYSAWVMDVHTHTSDKRGLYLVTTMFTMHLLSDRNKSTAFCYQKVILPHSSAARPLIRCIQDCPDSGFQLDWYQTLPNFRDKHWNMAQFNYDLIFSNCENLLFTISFVSTFKSNKIVGYLMG